MEKFDLIVIGGGSGLDVANGVAEQDKTVAIIEKDKLGGTCLNRGCIPSKLLIHSADVVETIRKANLFGIDVPEFHVNFEKIVERVNGIIDPDAQAIENNLKKSDNPKFFHGDCQFVDEKTLAVNDQKLFGNKILIASGSRPNIPKIDGLGNTDYITSDEALRLKNQPKTLTIVGGGYIACELAHFFGSLGTKINIIQRHNVLLPNEDGEISKKFTEIFSKKYSVYTEFEPYQISKQNKNFQVRAKGPSDKKIDLESDQLLIATGRKPNSDTLALEKTGVDVNKKGEIITNGFLETTKKGIYALGDVVGRYPFKHSANQEAKYAFYNILRPDQKKVDYEAMPHGIFSSPQIAGVGPTEEELKNKNVDYLKSSFPYINTGMGKAIEDNEGFVKLLVRKNDGKILGCHIMGCDATTLIHEVIVAMKTSSTIDAINDAVHIHPALSEVISKAASQF